MTLRAAPQEAVLIEVAARRLYAAKMARERIPPEQRPNSVRAWAERHRRIDGHDFTLRRFPPLPAIYADDSTHIVVMKPAQRGISEWAINYACFALEEGARRWAPDKEGLNVAYILPTNKALSDFSKERFSGLLSESDHMRALFSGQGAFDAITFKKAGRSYLYLRGGWSEAALLTFPADVLILDEFDKMATIAVQLARRRLNASEVKRELDISTPTMEGAGIHAMFLQSDQHVYETRCPSCGYWHTYDFFDDVWVDGEAYDPKDGGWRYWDQAQIRTAEVVELRCPSCRYALSDAERCDPDAGRWTSLAPEVKSLRGYHVPWWPFPFVDLRSFAVSAVSAEPSEVQELYRSDLGLPFSPAGSRITDDMLDRLSAPLDGGELPAGPWYDVTMGVDVGARFHYQISATAKSRSGQRDANGQPVFDPTNPPHVLAKGAVRTFEELDVLLRQYHVRQAVIDALPELHGAQAWALKHGARVYRAFYPRTLMQRGMVHVADPQSRTVRINRTAAMDAVYASIASYQRVWPESITRDDEVRRHMKAPARVTTVDPLTGEEKPAWVHTSPDHGFHSAVYDEIARRMLPAPTLVLDGAESDQFGVSTSKWRGR